MNTSHKELPCISFVVDHVLLILAVSLLCLSVATPHAVAAGLIPGDWSYQGTDGTEVRFTVDAQGKVGSVYLRARTYTSSVNISIPASKIIQSATQFGGTNMEHVVGFTKTGMVLATIHAQNSVSGSFWIKYQPGESVSGSFLITFNGNPPSNVVISPSSLEVLEGGTASFTVSASGSGLSYQWRQDGVDLTSNNIYRRGEQTTNLSFIYVVPGHAGLYSVAVSNAGGTTVSADARLTVIPACWLTVRASPTSGGTVSGGGAYAYGTWHSVTAVANSGYVFGNWTEDGRVLSSGASESIWMYTSRTLVANFYEASTVSLDVSTWGAGTVSGSGTFTNGSVLTVTATATTGYQFTHWSESGSIVSSDANYAFTLTTNRTLVACFSRLWTVSLSVSPAGIGSVSGSGTYADGSTVTVEASANSGYQFENWTQNGTIISTLASFTFPVSNNLSLTANFLEPYAVTTLAGPSDEGAGWCDGTGTTAAFDSPSGLAVDANGNVYVADTGNNTIRKVTPAGVVMTLAGSAGNSGSVNGTGSAARFHQPSGVAVDTSGNIYVADTGNFAIRKVTPAGVVTTVAESGYPMHLADPSGLVVDSGGVVHVVSPGSHTICKVTPDGVVTILAGAEYNPGSADGTGSAARFYHPAGLATDSNGNSYVADKLNHTIRKVTPAGVVTTLAGSAGSSGSADGTGSGARFYGPAGVAVDGSGNIYVADQWNETIRKVTPTGAVTTLAGSAGYSGSADGTGSAARFYRPAGVAVDRSGNIYVADTGNHAIRKITPAGVVTTLAGSAGYSGAGDSGGADGTGSAARFSDPEGVSVDGNRDVYVADTANHTIRKITPSGVVTTLAGLAGNLGSADGTGSAARFSGPQSLAVDCNRDVYVADTGNHTIRKVTPSGVVTTVAGSAGNSGGADGTGSAARFYGPAGVAADCSGNVYVADSGNHTIRKITPSGVVSTLAGSVGSQGSVDSAGSAARFFQPWGVSVDTSGNVYVADSGNHTIRKITPSGVVTTLAGSAGSGGSADGTGSGARFFWPAGVAVDRSGNIYVADLWNHSIRKVTPAGRVTRLAGSPGNAGSADATGSAARFAYPRGVAVDSSGNAYVADSHNASIRKASLPLPDLPTIDQDVAPVGSTRRLDVTNGAATSWSWRIVRHPANSSAELSSTTIRNPTFTPDVPDLYVFRLTATNASGSSGGGLVSLQAFSSAPSLTITRPTNPSDVVSATVLLAGTASDAGLRDEGIASVTVNGVRANNDTATGSGTANWSRMVSLNFGTNRFYIVATDTANNATTNVLDVVRVVDIQSPALAITSHTNGQQVGPLVTLAGTASDAGLGNHGVASVSVNGVRATNDTATGAATANWSLPVNLALGTNTLLLIATDLAGSTTTNFFRLVRVDFTPPALAISSHANGQTVFGSSIALAGTASDAGRGDTGIGSVTVNGARANGDTATGTGSAAWSLPLALAPRSNLVTVIASDLAGNRTTNSIVIFFADPSPPWLSISSPVPKQRWSNAVFTARGTAGDNAQLAGVRCQLNGGSWSPADCDTTAGSWTADLNLLPGTNVLSACAFDSSGNLSATTQVSFVYVFNPTMTVQITGNGTVTPNYNGRPLQLGKSYTVTAKPASGWIFAGWTGSQTGSALALTVTLRTNITLHATFIRDPFLPYKGDYAGLISCPDSVGLTNNGFFKATLAAQGSFSASLQLGGGTYSLAGRFPISGILSTSVVRKGKSPLSLQLQVDLAGADEMTGQVSDSEWTADLLAERAVYSRTNPAPQAGKRYTLVFPGADDSSTLPGGWGFGTLTVDTSGKLTFSGTLGDGTKVTQSTFVSKHGAWPLWSALYSSKGLLHGWLSFSNEPDRDLDGLVRWMKPPVSGVLYPNGFAFIDGIEAIGSTYANTAGTRVLNLTNGQIVLTGGNLSRAITNGLALSAKNTVTGTNRLSLKITTSSGLFQGSVVNPSTGKTVSFNGVLLQKLTAGYGFFRGTNQTGTVYLGPNE